jgi:AraC-like DNA-binding protein
MRAPDPNQLSSRCPVFAERFLCLSGFSFKERYHQLLLPLRGALLAGGRAQRGHAVLVPGGAGGEVRAAPRVDVFRLGFSPAFGEELATRGLQSTPLPVLQGLLSQRLTTVVLPPDLTDEIQDCMTRVLSAPSRSLLRIRSVELLLLIGGLQEETPRTPVQKVDSVVDYVEAHYGEPLTLSGLAERSRLSPTHLSRAFRERFGVPLFEHINAIRIRKACLLLKRSDLPILEIAFSVGYNNVSFFNRYFRRIMQMTPSEYRKQILQ